MRATVSIGRSDGDQLLGDPPQHGVAGGVALGVVDLLEAVEVDEEDRRAAGRCASSVGQRLVDAVDEQGAVGQAGQRVVGRLLGEGGLGVLQIGHALGLRLAEPGDLAVLGLLGAEVGEREAGELVAVDLEGRDADQDRDRRRRRASTRSSSTVAPEPPGPRIAPADRDARRPRTSPAATRRSSRVEHDSSSASRRLAYRIEPVRRERGRPVAHVLDEHPVGPVGGRQREHPPAVRRRRRRRRRRPRRRRWRAACPRPRPSGPGVGARRLRRRGSRAWTHVAARADRCGARTSGHAEPDQPAEHRSRAPGAPCRRPTGRRRACAPGAGRS